MKKVVSPSTIDLNLYTVDANSKRDTEGGQHWNPLGPLGAATYTGAYRSVLVFNSTASTHYVAIGGSSMAAPTGPSDGIPVPAGRSVVINTGAYDCVRSDSAGVYGYWAPDNLKRSDPAPYVVLTPPFTNATSLYFDGGTKYVDFGNTAFRYDIADQFSISAWIKLPVGAVTPYPQIFTNTGGIARGIVFALNKSGPQWSPYVQMFNSGGSYIYAYGPQIISDGQWVHVVMTYDGSGVAAGLHIYVNGVDQPLTVARDNLGGGTLVGTGRAVLGQDLAGDWFYGNMDEVSFWNATLSQADITALGGSPGDLAALAGLASWYRFEPSLTPADSDITIYDRKGTNNGAGHNLVIGDFVADVP